MEPIDPTTHSGLAPTCPRCHVTVRPTDYYCYNCGKNLHPAPLQTDAATLVGFFLKVVLLPPMGIVWGVRYLQQKDDRSKIVGVAAISITVVEIVFVVQYAVGLINQVNSQMNTLQLPGF